MRFENLPPAGKFLASYQEAGMKITTRNCADPNELDSLGRHSRFEPQCLIFLSGSTGNGALRASEVATSYYLFSLDGAPFDLVGFDIVSLFGAGEITASNGAKIVFSSFKPEFSRFKLGNRPQPYHYSVFGEEWKNITWFIFKDAGGGATIDNLEFEASP